MDRDRVRELEEEIGKSISSVLADLGEKHASNQPLVHLMAKAAVTILEAAEARHPGG
ncbi:hypothetical protein OAF37_00665 [Rubripirellula sp.]|nr:hypothetical protein [Rubripirellula sp.]MDA7914856.1 hypothetical protein [bacterium]MDB4557617.1 hypothetical protein [bacterium]MDB4644544.1 hypothetical protein [Rubripirellula sp.]MDB4770486.1 hypothetical protein [bacterium]